MNLRGLLKASAAFGAVTVLYGMVGTSASFAASLEEALQAAYDNNPTLLAQRAGLRVTDETVSQAMSGWRPTVEASGSLGFLTEEDETSTTKTDDDRSFYNASLTATQNLYAGGATTSGVDSAEASVLAARARLKAAEQSVLLDAATAYLDVLRDKAVLELNQQNELRLKKQLEATRDRFEVGEVTRTDVAQAESRLSGARASTIQAVAALEISKAAYVEVVGEEITGTVNAPVLNLGLPTSRIEAIELAQGMNPSIQARNYDYTSSLEDIKTAEASFRPNLDLVGSASYANDVSTDDLESTDASVRLNLTVPIYQAGLVSSQVRSAKETASQAKVLIEQERRIIAELATTSWENLKSARAQIQAREDEVRANFIAFEGVEQEAIVGSRTVLDVLDAEQDLLDAQVNLVRAKRDENVAQFTLLSATGGLTIADLGLGGELYDAESYYNTVKNLWYGTGENSEAK
ncbi:MAG: TolC family outer membrane protein [Alphaproteobacteria bacterium]|nr:TolC family outer membrane protein [Alphaproteobacteria bacterium]